MKLVSLVSGAVMLASAFAAAVPAPEGVDVASEPAPITLIEPSPLAKRADVWCRVEPDGGEYYARCRAGPTRQKEVRKWIAPNEQFGVRCKKKGDNISGVVWWDYIPGWNCYVSAYLTRPVGSRAQCETGVPVC